jgi:hypothetical protein
MMCWFPASLGAENLVMPTFKVTWGPPEGKWEGAGICVESPPPCASGGLVPSSHCADGTGAQEALWGSVLCTVPGTGGLKPCASLIAPEATVRSRSAGLAALRPWRSSCPLPASGLQLSLDCGHLTHLCLCHPMLPSLSLKNGHTHPSITISP